MKKKIILSKEEFDVNKELELKQSEGYDGFIVISLDSKKLFDGQGVCLFTNIDNDKVIRSLLVKTTMSICQNNTYDSREDAEANARRITQAKNN